MREGGWAGASLGVIGLVASFASLVVMVATGFGWLFWMGAHGSLL